MTEISRMLREEIARQGPITFARFMEQALYCPKIGYYERDAAGVGQAGDFYTSVSTGPLFGHLLAFQFAEWLEQLPARPVQLVEAGAHDGRLAADILAWLGDHRPALAAEVRYWILEPSPRRQAWQQARLEFFAGQVGWFDHPGALGEAGVNGVIFSNELLDALPVRRLGWDAAAQSWFEWGVGLSGEDFVWQQLPGAGLVDELKAAGLDAPPELLAVLPDGFTVEISPTAAEWWRQAALALRAGKLLTLDYGLAAGEFFAPQRGHGTVRAYRQHQASGDVLAAPGEQDLTAHVNFTHLQRVGETAGLRTDGWEPQARFLTRLAERTWRKESAFGEWTPAMKRQFQTLTHPEHLGRPFRVLVQSR